MVDVVALLDLGAQPSREALVEALRERRRLQLKALTGLNPGVAPSLMAALRATRTEEVRLCEETLRGMGEAFEAEA